jgi:hypothetical protein
METLLTCLFLVASAGFVTALLVTPYWSEKRRERWLHELEGQNSGWIN